MEGGGPNADVCNICQGLERFGKAGKLRYLIPFPWRKDGRICEGRRRFASIQIVNKNV